MNCNLLGNRHSGTEYSNYIFSICTVHVPIEYRIIINKFVDPLSIGDVLRRSLTRCVTSGYQGNQHQLTSLLAVCGTVLLARKAEENRTK